MEGRSKDMRKSQTAKNLSFGATTRHCGTCIYCTVCSNNRAAAAESMHLSSTLRSNTTCGQERTYTQEGKKTHRDSTKKPRGFFQRKEKKLLCTSLCRRPVCAARRTLPLVEEKNLKHASFSLLFFSRNKSPRMEEKEVCTKNSVADFCHLLAFSPSWTFELANCFC